MKSIFWLISYIVSHLLHAVLKVGIEIIVRGVRLLYWSIRTYGFLRVVIFFIALWVSVELHIRMEWLTASSASIGSMLVVTLALWGTILMAVSWLNRRLQHYFHLPTPVQLHGTLVPTQHHTQTIATPKIASRYPLPSRVHSTDPQLGSQIVSEHLIPSHGPGTPLWEKTACLATLQKGWQRVLQRGGSPGSDGITVETFLMNKEQNLRNLTTDLQAGTYKPSPPRWIAIPKPNGDRRQLAILCVRDRIVQHALLSILMPMWDPQFAPACYAYRPGRSAIDAVTAVEQTLISGRPWVVHADIQTFFDCIPHPPLFTLLEEKWLSDQNLRRVIQLCVQTTSPQPAQGVAQGAALSPLLTNVYLDRFDRTVTQIGAPLVRYADDFLLLCATRPQAEEALKTVERLLQGLGLHLNPQKSYIVHRDEGFTFLGYTFTREGKQPSEQAIHHLRTRLKEATNETTRHQIVAGWKGYFREVPKISETIEEAGQACDPLVLAPDTDLSEWHDEHAWKPRPADIDHAPLGKSHPDKPLLLHEPNTLLVNSCSAVLSWNQDSTLYRKLFLRGSDLFAQFQKFHDRYEYVPVYRAMTDADIADHLQGNATLGTYLIHPDGTTRAIVLDIDSPNLDKTGQALAFPIAQNIFMTFRQEGVTPIWMDSGGKGFHLWLCMADHTLAQGFRETIDQWLNRFRPFPNGVIVELFPKEDVIALTAMGTPIRLPFGYHPLTGRPSQLLTPDGQPVANPWAILASTPLINPATLLKAVTPSTEENSLPEPPQAIAPLINGCKLVYELAVKARRIHHLRHAERLALLYTLGPLGDVGKAYLHQVIGLCSNYDPRITERWIQRSEERFRTVRCTTLKELLKDHLPGIACPCPSKRAHPSPLDWLRSAQKKEHRKSVIPPTPIDARDNLWEGVSEDLFGEVTSPQQGCSTLQREGSS